MERRGFKKGITNLTAVCVICVTLFLSIFGCGELLDSSRKVSGFHVWPQWRGQLQLEENKVLTDQKFGFDEGEINSLSLAEAEATGADAIKAAVIIFKGTSDPSERSESQPARNRSSARPEESLHFAALGFCLL